SGSLRPRARVRCDARLLCQRADRPHSVRGAVAAAAAHARGLLELTGAQREPDCPSRLKRRPGALEAAPIGPHTFRTASGMLVQQHQRARLIDGRAPRDPDRKLGLLVIAPTAALAIVGPGAMIDAQSE